MRRSFIHWETKSPEKKQFKPKKREQKQSPKILNPYPKILHFNFKVQGPHSRNVLGNLRKISYLRTIYDDMWENTNQT